MKPFRMFTLLSISALALAGCGSSKSKSTQAAAPATPASTSSSTPAPAAAGTVVTAKHSKLGTILAAGPKKLTVYLFEADKGTTSACSGACAHAWPPVTTSGSAQATGAALSSDLGTTKRPDGTEQVTYKGHPLYYFIKDGDAGDAYGEGNKAFGASWYVLTPKGSKVDKS